MTDAISQLETVSQCAARSGIAFTRIQRAIASLGIQPRRWAGNCRLFDRADLDRVIEEIKFRR